MRSLVAVSQRSDALPERREVRDALDQNLVRFLLEVDCLAVPVPNGLLEHGGAPAPAVLALEEWLAAVAPMALVLSGGNDIHQCPERDATERWLLDHAQEHRLPVLGICRGMQMLAHWAGAELRAIDGHVRTRHRIAGEITGDVNSFHAYGIGDCPPGFRALARAEDGHVEAFAHGSLPWEGWMWHPERETPFAERDLERARRLLKRSRT